jgi:hypothetical protein
VGAGEDYEEVEGETIELTLMVWEALLFRVNFM